MYRKNHNNKKQRVGTCSFETPEKLLLVNITKRCFNKLHRTHNCVLECDLLFFNFMYKMNNMTARKITHTASTVVRDTTESSCTSLPPLLLWGSFILPVVPVVMCVGGVFWESFLLSVVPVVMSVGGVL